MGFWIFLTLCTLTVPVTMIITGAAFKNGKPKDINCLSGFRTADSVKSDETWRFANSYCGALWLKAGLVLVPINLAAAFLFRNADADAQSLFALIISVADIIVMICAVIRTQKELKKRFDEYGNPVKPRN